MPIFRRRSIQQILDENRQVLPQSIISDHARKLNAQNERSLATEWEVVIANALSKCGLIEFEKPHGGKAPDVTFSSQLYGNFLADITTVSDKGYEDANPVDYFCDCIKQHFRKYGVSAGGVLIQPKSIEQGRYYNDKKVNICLPHKGDIPKFVKENFAKLMAHIKSSPQSTYKQHIADMGCSLDVTYTPSSKNFSAYFSSYTVPYSLQKNPIYKGLRKKAEQLKNCDYIGVMGIFLCDGDCAALNDSMYWAEKYTLADIVNALFSNYTSISFVVVFAIQEEQGSWGHQTTRSIKNHVFINRKARSHPPPLIRDLIENLCKHLPEPTVTPRNALNHMKAVQHEGNSFLGGFKMEKNEMFISSRMLTEILAGKLDYKKHIQDMVEYSPNKHDFVSERFHCKLAEGQMIKSIRVVPTADDDDWIAITYGEADPAISKFH